jgi:hypothetical protein
MYPAPPPSPARAASRRLAGLVAAALAVLLAGCGGGAPAGTPAAPAAADPAAAEPGFDDVTAAWGLDFRHRHGGSGRRYMVETMGSGGAMVDFDGDGDHDLYLVQAGPLPGSADPAPLANRLYRNRGDGTLEEVADAAGAGDTGYGMGVCAGDADNDGAVDLYVTNFGPDRFYRNRGDGRFEEAAGAAGLANPDWGMGCAFADYDRDGWLDLYVVNYVGFGFDVHRRCGPVGLPMYCHPDVYPGVPDRRLPGYRSRGTATPRTAPRAIPAG